MNKPKSTDMKKKYAVVWESYIVDSPAKAAKLYEKLGRSFSWDLAPSK